EPEFDASVTFLFDAIGRFGHCNNHRMAFGIVIPEFQNEFGALSSRETQRGAATAEAASAAFRKCRRRSWATKSSRRCGYGAVILAIIMPFSGFDPLPVLPRIYISGIVLWLRRVYEIFATDVME